MVDAVTPPFGGPTPTATRAPTPTPAHTATYTLTPAPLSSPTPTPTHTLTPSPSPTASEAETIITLQQESNGYWGSEDTYIYQYAPNANYCRQELLRVGYKQQYAGLLHFDLSSVPSNAVVTQATLQLYAAGWGGSNVTIGAYCVMRGVNICQATWNQAQSGDAWSQPGGNDTTTDRRGSAESSVITNGIGRWYTFDLTAAVQGWLDGSLANNGVLLRAAYSSSSFSFASAQNGTVSLHPRLTIKYRQ